MFHLPKNFWHHLKLVSFEHTALSQCLSDERVPDNMACHFPFTVDGELHDSCVTGGQTRPWCSVQNQYRNDNWRYCREGESEYGIFRCSLSSLLLRSTSYLCLHNPYNVNFIACANSPMLHTPPGDAFPTVQECVFPFTYNGQEVFTCIGDNSHRPWCSLERFYDYNGEWKYCNPCEHQIVVVDCDVSSYFLSTNYFHATPQRLVSKP